jgi:hypothetical protein
LLLQYFFQCLQLLSLSGHNSGFGGGVGTCVAENKQKLFTKRIVLLMAHSYILVCLIIHQVIKLFIVNTTPGIKVCCFLDNCMYKLIVLYGHRGRYRKVVGFTTTYAINAYHH